MIDAAAAYSGQGCVKPALGYIRVSREEQARNGVSLDAQRDRIRAYALAKGLQLLEVFADEGFSGKGLNRPGVELLLKKCATGEIGHVIVWKLDRLTRRTRDLLQMVEDVFLARGVEMHSVSESLDTGTPHGRFVLTLFGSLAQMERELVGAVRVQHCRGSARIDFQLVTHRTDFDQLENAPRWSRCQTNSRSLAGS